MSGAAPAPRIRRGRWREWRVIRRLVDAAYTPYVLPLSIQPSHWRGYFRRLMINRQIWVLEDRGKLIGTIGIQDGSINLYLGLVTVHPEAQGRGFGRILVEFAEAQARSRGLVRLTLDTHEHFADAIEFYRHLGFVEVGRQPAKDYVAVRMLKRLDLTAPRP